jgi:hypothetical protein
MMETALVKFNRIMPLSEQFFTPKMITHWFPELNNAGVDYPVLGAQYKFSLIILATSKLVFKRFFRTVNSVHHQLPVYNLRGNDQVEGASIRSPLQFDIFKLAELYPFEMKNILFA